MKLALALLALTLSLTEGVMVCYFGSWSTYRDGVGKFDVEDIDAGICTHLIFSFAGLNESTYEIEVLDPWNDLCENGGNCAYDRFIALKEQNGDLKTLLAVGGWGEGSAKYSQMVKDPAKRKKFIDSSIALLKAHNFDGLDMDWEFPGHRGGVPEDKENFIYLLQELKEALHAESMILTAAVSSGKATIDLAYDIPGMAANLDLLNLMTYDMHGGWEPFTHHQSPLYPHPMDEGETLWLNVNFAVEYWILGGMPANKIVLGVPLYGRCYGLANGQINGFYAPADHPAQPGENTMESGMLAYYEICDMQQKEGWTIVNDPSMHEPYTYYLPRDDIWCAYEHAESCKTKASYARIRNLAGIMVWSIDLDDFNPLCHGRKFELIKTLTEEFSSS